MGTFLRLVAFSGLLVSISIVTVDAQTADGQTPAAEQVCERNELGGVLKGLCTAYCEAMDCDESPNADFSACESVRSKFIGKSGGIELPCLVPPALDTDYDGIPDDVDNCAFTPNTDQSDDDQDGVGNVCDNCPSAPNPDQADLDGDGLGDVCDNCPVVGNTDQADFDDNGVGDACETDADADGIPDTGFLGIECTGGETLQCEDNCPNTVNPMQEDSDGDGIGDDCDNCPNDANADQADSDSNGVGDACEAVSCPDGFVSCPDGSCVPEGESCGITPETVILSGPSDPSNNLSANFLCSDPTGVAVSYECSEDIGNTWVSCPSGAYEWQGTLEDGQTYTFLVRGVNDFGVFDPTPASYTWTIQLGL